MIKERMLKLDTFILAGSILIFLIYSLVYLDYVGLNYDEAPFINGALAGSTDDFIYKKIFNVPLMMFPYVGALKCWIFYPIFSVFGVNLVSIRLPSILISALAMIIWYKNANLIFSNKKYSTAFLLLMATDPSFINHSRFYETIPLQSLLMALSFYFYFKFLTRNVPSYLFFFFFVLILGIFNKFNFIWFAFAIIIAIFLWYRKEFLSGYRKHVVTTNLISLLFLFVIGLFLISIYSLMHFPVGGNFIHISFIEKIKFMLPLYLMTMRGSFPYITIFNKDISAIFLVNIIEISIIALGLFVAAKSKITHNKSDVLLLYRKNALFFLSIFILLAFFVVLTPQARGSYHIMILWPLSHLLFLLSFQELSFFLNHKLSKQGLFVLTALIVSSQLMINNHYIVTMARTDVPKSIYWTTAINHLSHYVNQHAKSYDEIVSIDFGIDSQLIAFATDNSVRKKIHPEVLTILTSYPALKQIRDYIRPEFHRNDDANLRWLYDSYFKAKHVLVIMFADAAYVTQAANFISFSEKYHLKLKHLAYINDDAGNIIYSLYSS